MKHLLQNSQFRVSHYIERAIRKRTCHMCNTTIKRGISHFAIYRRTSFFWSARTNFCVFCMEDLCFILKKSIKGKIKSERKERYANLLLQEL